MHIDNLITAQRIVDDINSFLDFNSALGSGTIKNDLDAGTEVVGILHRICLALNDFDDDFKARHPYVFADIEIREMPCLKVYLEKVIEDES